jgi:hypothetical protein
MRRIEVSRRPEEASCGVRNELLNRGSGVRISAPAPLRVFNIGPRARAALPARIATILPIVWLRPGYTAPDPNSGAAVFQTAAKSMHFPGESAGFLRSCVQMMVGIQTPFDKRGADRRVS